MDPVCSSFPTSSSAPSNVRVRPKLVISASGTPSHGPMTLEEEDDLFGTFLKVAKNCLALPSLSKDNNALPHSSSDSRIITSSLCRSNNNNKKKKRVRKRHPATIQTPGRRIPTEEEAAVEPLTSTSTTTPCTDVFDEDLDEDHPFSSSHYHHEEELMILGEWEFDEEGFPGHSNESPFEEEWLDTDTRIPTFSGAAKIEDMYQYPRKKLSNSLNGDIPVLTLYS